MRAAAASGARSFADAEDDEPAEALAAIAVPPPARSRKLAQQQLLVAAGVTEAGDQHLEAAAAQAHPVAAARLQIGRQVEGEAGFRVQAPRELEAATDQGLQPPRALDQQAPVLDPAAAPVGAGLQAFEAQEVAQQAGDHGRLQGCRSAATSAGSASGGA